jgi:hypothetical protein
MRKSNFEFKSPFASRKATLKREKTLFKIKEDETLSGTPIRLREPKSGRLFDKQGFIALDDCNSFLVSCLLSVF